MSAFKKILVLVFVMVFVFGVSVEGVSSKDKIRIYCSGPMGGEPDFEIMRAISDALKDAGYKTYLPVDDGFPLLVMYDVLEKNEKSKAKIAESKYWMCVAVYALDIFNLLKNCNAVICNVNPYLNAKVNPDSGSVMEVSVAYAYNRPIAFYKSRQARMLPAGSTSANGWDNPMIVGIANHFNLNPDYTAPTIPELVRNIEKEISKAGSLVMKDGSYQFEGAIPLHEMPVQIQNYINLGQGVHKIKDRYKGQELKGQLALKVMNEVVDFVKGNASKYNVARWNGYVPPAKKITESNSVIFNHDAAIDEYMDTEGKLGNWGKLGSNLDY